MNAEQESLAPSQPAEEPGAKLFGDRDAAYEAIRRCSDD